MSTTYNYSTITKMTTTLAFTYSLNTIIYSTFADDDDLRNARSRANILLFAYVYLSNHV
jgi:hypothetical protein